MRFMLTIVATMLWFITMFSPLNAQDTLWSRNYGSASASELGLCGTVTSDGGYAICGISYAFSGVSGQFWLVRTDANGDTLWTRDYGGSRVQEAHYVIQTDDGGFAICGMTSVAVSDYDVYIVKTDSIGDTLWTRRFGVPGDDDKGWAIIETSDGGYMAVGQGIGQDQYGDFFMVRLDSDGELLWTKHYGGSQSDYAYGVVETSDGGFALTGGNTSGAIGGADLWLVRTNADGDSLWTRRYDFHGGLDVGNAIVTTPDGGFVVAGRTWLGSYAQLLALRTDSLGNIVWTRELGIASTGEFSESIDKTSDGGFVIGGGIGISSFDFYIARLSASGDSLWAVSYDGPGNRSDDCYEIRVAQDNSIMAFGYSYIAIGNPDYWLLKIIDGSLTEYGYLSGVVKEEDDTTPIEDVEVSVYDGDDNLKGTDTTDVDGEFNFTLQADTYYATFSKDGYFDTTLAELEVAPEETTFVSLIMYRSCCDYRPGDMNGDGNVLGGDVTYAVRYLKGNGQVPPDSCWNDSTASCLYSAADANGNCIFNGADVTFLVGFFKGYNPSILWCPQTPPCNPIAPLIKNEDESSIMAPRR